MHSPLSALIATVLLLAAPCPSCAASEPVRADDPLVLEVMSFNLRWGPDPAPNGWNTRRALVIELLRDEAPAVLGLQESRAQYVDALLSQLPRYAAYPVTGNRQNSILYCKSRFRLDAVTSDADNARADAPAEDWGEGSVRLPLGARLVDERSGLAFYVYNNHFDHRSAASRRWSAGVLLDRVRSRAFADPVVLTGDFNARANDPALALLRGEAATGEPDAGLALRFVDTFRERHPDEIIAATYHAFLGTRIGSRVDYVFAGPGFRVLRARILRFERNGRYPSDHFPVAATLSIEAGDASASPASRKADDDQGAPSAPKIASGRCPSGVSR